MGHLQWCVGLKPVVNTMTHRRADTGEPSSTHPASSWHHHDGTMAMMAQCMMELRMVIAAMPHEVN